MGIFMTLGFVVAERVLYVPSIGFCLLLGIVLDHFMPATGDHDGGESGASGSESKQEGKGRGKAGKAVVSEAESVSKLSTAGKIALVVGLVVVVLYGVRCVRMLFRWH